MAQAERRRLVVVVDQTHQLALVKLLLVLGKAVMEAMEPHPQFQGHP